MILDQVKKKPSQATKKQYIVSGSITKEDYDFIKKNKISVSLLIRASIKEIIKNSNLSNNVDIN